MINPMISTRTRSIAVDQVGGPDRRHSTAVCRGRFYGGAHHVGTRSAAGSAGRRSDRPPRGRRHRRPAQPPPPRGRAPRRATARCAPPGAPFPPSIFLDKNRRDIGKSQSIWASSKMKTAGSPCSAARPSARRRRSAAQPRCSAAARQPPRHLLQSKRPVIE
jgi:hypothetical protein